MGRRRNKTPTKGKVHPMNTKVTTEPVDLPLSANNSPSKGGELMAGFVHAREAFNRMPRRVLPRVTHLQLVFLSLPVTFVSPIGESEREKT